MARIWTTLAGAALLGLLPGAAALAGERDPSSPAFADAARRVRDCEVIDKAFDWSSGNHEPAFDLSHLERFSEPQTRLPLLTLEDRLGDGVRWRGISEVACPDPRKLPARNLTFLAPWYSADGRLALVHIAEGPHWRAILLRRDGDGWVVETERPVTADYRPVEIEEVI